MYMYLGNTEAKCPYCGHVKSIHFNSHTLREDTDAQIVTCNLDDGGCDRQFALKITAKFSFSADVTALDWEIPDKDALDDWAENSPY